jgi:hypothetical protein
VVVSLGRREVQRQSDQGAESKLETQITIFGPPTEFNLDLGMNGV